MHVRIQRGDRGSGPPLENHKKGFFSNAGPDPLKIVKLPSQLSILGHNRHASERHLNGASLADRRGPTNSGIWTIPPPSKGWTLSDKTFWIRACSGYG